MTEWTHCRESGRPDELAESPVTPGLYLVLHFNDSQELELRLSLESLTSGPEFGMEPEQSRLVSLLQGQAAE